MVLLTIAHRKYGFFCFLLLKLNLFLTLRSAGLEVLVPDRRLILAGDTTKISLSWKLRLTPWPLWVSDALKLTG